jgi:aspartyl-tRNA(Asn)/glutamyl-tRNA(Gln) amidotransferase subunit A
VSALHALTAEQARGLLDAGEVSSVELTGALLARIEEVEPSLHAFVTIDADGALHAAREADAARARGEGGFLRGIPIGVKDLMDVAGLPTEAGSAARRGQVATRDAAVVETLRAGGAVILGKTVTHEFAFGSESPPARNAWDPTRIPGGSSGGSAAAVAAGECPVALGSDTGSSIRNPASLNGVTGLKPTYGRVSRSGIVPCAWSCDHVGPIARTAGDCRRAFEVLAGVEVAALPNDVAGKRLGVPERFFFERIEPSVERAVRDALAVLEGLGARLVPVEVEHVELSFPVAAIVCMVEGASYHADYREGRALYGEGVQDLLAAGELVPAWAHLDAQRMRTLVCRGLRDAFLVNRLDAIVCPTSPIGPVTAGQHELALPHEEPLPVIDHYARLTCPFNLSGLPALTVPCGLDADGLPVGLQIAGRPLEEDEVLRIGATYQAHTDWHGLRP